MTYTVIYEKITDGLLPEGYYYAHLPTLDLTTHGLGVEDAKDLLKAWIEEKLANGEKVPIEDETLVSQIVIKVAVHSL